MNTNQQEIERTLALEKELEEFGLETIYEIPEEMFQVFKEMSEDSPKKEYSEEEDLF